MKAPILHLFSADCQLLAAFGDYESLVLNRSWQGIGTFELALHAGAQHAGKLVRGRILVPGKNWHKAVYIEAVRYEASRGQRVMTVSGRQLKCAAAWRIIRPPTQAEAPEAYGWDRITGAAEIVMRHYAKRHMVSPADENRAIPKLDLEAAADPPRGLHVPWQARWEGLDKHLEEISAWCDTGWNIALDYPNRRWLWTYEPGRDLAYGSGGLSYIVFDDRHQLRDVEYTEDDADYASAFDIGGAGEDEARLVQTVYTDRAGNRLDTPLAGLERIEAWVEGGGIDMPDELIEEGLHRIRERLRPLSSIRAQVSEAGYEKQWDLGDRVTVALHAKHTGVDAHRHERITAIQEGYTRGESRLTVTFGEDAPVIRTALERLKHQQPVR